MVLGKINFVCLSVCCFLKNDKCGLSFWRHCTNTQHLHDETKVFPMDTHLKLHATQLKQLTQTQTHSLHDLNAYLNWPRNIKTTIFHNSEHTSGVR